MAEKTQDPTPKRILDARARGDVPRAPLIAGAVGLLAMVPLVRAAILRLSGDVVSVLMNPVAVERIDAWWFALAVIAATAPVALVLIAIAVASGVAQGSITFSPSTLAPDASKLAGIGRLFDKSNIWSAFRGLLVVLLLSWILGRMVLASAWNARDPVSSAASAATRIVLAGGAVACAFAVIDAIVGRRIWLGRLRMSPDEVTREHKESEGDPEVKQRREELHHELLAAETLTAVRDATVIVINPTHLACALRYDGGDEEEGAPTLVAKGHGALAARMIEAAKFYGIPVIEDVPVARALYDLEVGIEIPEALYEAVASVLQAAWEGDDQED